MLLLILIEEIYNQVHLQLLYQINKKPKAGIIFYPNSFSIDYNYYNIYIFFF